MKAVPKTLAESVAAALASHGVRRMFGIPGGGSSLDLIDAAGAQGIEFVLTRTEAAAAIMAAVTGELTGKPGVVLAGVGPGAASTVNGIAYAYLEKAPLILFTDGPASSRHQAFDQGALFSPITKSQGRLRPGNAGSEIETAINIALKPPWGPVHLDLTATDASTLVPDSASATPTELKIEQPGAKDLPSGADSIEAEAACRLLTDSRNPVIIAGMESRYRRGPEMLRKLTDALSCPVLMTYKAKGVLPDTHPCNVGTFTGAEAEAEIVNLADLIVLFGLDPVELIAGKWDYDAKILDLFPHPGIEPPAPPACQLIGSLADTVNALLRDDKKSRVRSNWALDEITGLRDQMRARLSCSGDGHTAQSVVECARHVAPDDCRATVDAGAHMFSTLSSWLAAESFGVLKSNGLSTMGYALPAAIASCLAEPDRPVVAFTGDGGIMMCLGELKTAIEHNCRIVVVVLNDGALSLIDIKQQRQGRLSRGVRYPAADLSRIAGAFGYRSWRVSAHEDMTPAMTAAFAHKAPCLIDVAVDPSGYGDQLVALRG